MTRPKSKWGKKIRELLGRLPDGFVVTIYGIQNSFEAKKKKSLIEEELEKLKQERLWERYERYIIRENADKNSPPSNITEEIKLGEKMVELAPHCPYGDTYIAFMNMYGGNYNLAVSDFSRAVKVCKKSYPYFRNHEVQMTEWRNIAIQKLQITQDISSLLKQEAARRKAKEPPSGPQEP